MGQANQAPIQINPSIPRDQMIAMINQNFEFLNQQNMTKVVSDGQTNRIIFGRLPDGTYGLVISKPGVDVIKLFS
jgi:hypothetical protein